MLRRLARHGAAGLLAVLAGCAHPAGGALAGPVPAGSAPANGVPAARDVLLAAGPPGWRITQVLPNLAAGGLWAGGARDAWLAGDACANLATCGVSDTSNGTIVVRHWDGTSWRAVKPPKAYINTPLDQGAGQVTATSASNVWLAVYRGKESVDYTDMLHWTGNGWAAPVRLPTFIQAAIATSATQLWAFGDAIKAGQAGYFAHLSGKVWTHGSFPVSSTAAAALSPTDVWTGGNTSSGAPGIEHWDGHKWRATPLPDLGLGGPPGTLPIAYVTGIAAVGSADVWANIFILGGPSGSFGTILVHWNGKAWTRARLPFAGADDGPVTTDGHGGIWLPLAASATKELWFCHFSAGRWTRTPVPSRSGEQPQVQDLAWIPGTRSVWAIGGVSFADLGTAILKDGT
jgi:hypothetical protein